MFFVVDDAKCTTVLQDPTELDLVHSTGVTVFTMEDVDLLGSREVMRRALEVANKGTTGFHFSFDMDGVDPDVAP